MTPTRRHFALLVHAVGDGSYSLELTVATDDKVRQVARLEGRHLNRLRQALTSAVVASKHARTVLTPTRKAPIPLTEDAGVRLALTALATAPVVKASRVEAIRIGVETMTSEEALYWYALCTGPNQGRALRAIRTLLAEE
jgi:predicted RNA-binding protein YlqC (UPF0109 family)